MRKSKYAKGKWTINRMAKLLNNHSPNYIKKHFCGDRIGRGKYRDVYAFKYDSSIVIKFERNIGHGRFCNVTEWCNYLDSLYTPLEKWLAKCMLISETGQILVQVRCERIIDGVTKKMPKKIPSLLTDCHSSNWGIYQGRWVIFDYPFFVNKWKMKKAKIVRV